MPYLLWQTNWHPAVQVLTFLFEEWAWNVFPSTRMSSFVVVAVYAAVLSGVWWNWTEEEGYRVDQGVKDGNYQAEKLARNRGINGIPA
jgi:ALG3 protein